MADTDDPWANHTRGTPLAEGSDPLSMSSSAGHSGDDGGKGKATDKEGSSSDGNAEDDGEDTVRADEFLYPASSVKDDLQHLSSNGHAAASPHQTAQGHEERLKGENEIAATGSKSVARPPMEEDQDDDDDDEAFVYPGSSSTQAQADIDSVQDDRRSFESRQRERIAPSEAVSTSDTTVAPQAAEVQSYTTASAPAKPIDYARLLQLCSQGPVSALSKFMEVTTSRPPVGSGVSLFALANEPNHSNGLAPIHIAAKEGKVDILRWLVREAGALVELEDREGETAVHKAALAGRLPAITFLLSAGASAGSCDGDGWTPLHNACSKGYLDIVKMLIENASCSVDVKGGRGAWTPLMSAASKGHLPVVRYLTTKQHVDPFIRNAAGETAYDVAAATFEIYICEVLEKYESEHWAASRFAGQNETSSRPGHRPYNPLTLHTTIPIILHENQRLDTRLSTLAIRGGKPRWSGTQAGRPDKADRRAPGTMPPGPISLSRTRHIPMARADVKLPTRDQPYKIRLPNRSAQIAAARRARGEHATDPQDDLGSTPTPESMMNTREHTGNSNSNEGRNEEPSHFWLSDWQTDFTHAQVDADEGWQYSQSFETADERWVAAAPPPLVRLLEGVGIGQSVQRAVNSVALASSGSASVAEAEAVSTGWVRRRRWVRVMRRRLDIEFGDDLESMERASLNVCASASDADTAAAQFIQETRDQAQAAVEALGNDADYLARAKALTGSFGSAEEDDQSLKRQIARLDLAIAELRQHAFCDADSARQQDAEELLKSYTLRRGQLRQKVGVEEESDDENDDDEEEFIYPNSYKDDGQSVVTRLGGAALSTVSGRPSLPQRQSSTLSVGGRSAMSPGSANPGSARSADLAGASEFRVPSQETPNRPTMAPASSQSSFGPHGLVEQSLLRTWEADADASNCRSCGRKFTFFVRKHHCRRCGKIFCDACSTHRAQLSADELIIDPGVPEMLLLESNGPSRICDGCEAERRLPQGLRVNRSQTMTAALDQLDNASSGQRRVSAGSDVSDGVSDVSSRASELNECPVCGRVLAGVSDEAEAQEEHVRQCLDNGGGGSVQGGRYLVYKLSEGPIVGKECQICLEELLVGMTIARLPCLCYYHRHCIDSWFSRGRTCPVHARAW